MEKWRKVLYICFMEKMKTVKVSTDIHKKLKVYSAKSEINVTLIVEQAVLNLMREFSAEELRDMPRKSKKQ